MPGKRTISDIKNEIQLSKSIVNDSSAFADDDIFLWLTPDLQIINEHTKSQDKILFKKTLSLIISILSLGFLAALSSNWGDIFVFGKSLPLFSLVLAAVGCIILLKIQPNPSIIEEYNLDVFAIGQKSFYLYSINSRVLEVHSYKNIHSMVGFDTDNDHKVVLVTDSESEKSSFFNRDETSKFIEALKSRIKDFP